MEPRGLTLRREIGLLEPRQLGLHKLYFQLLRKAVNLYSHGSTVLWLSPPGPGIQSGNAGQGRGGRGRGREGAPIAHPSLGGIPHPFIPSLPVLEVWFLLGDEPGGGDGTPPSRERRPMTLQTPGSQPLGGPEDRGAPDASCPLRPPGAAGRPLPQAGTLADITESLTAASQLFPSPPIPRSLCLRLD